MRSARLLVLLGLTSACGPAVPANDGGTDAPVDAGPANITVGSAERPAQVIVPFDHDGTTERPLVVLLHGYGANARLQDSFFGLSARTRARGIYLLLPDGTEDSGGSQFWNATDACCNFGGSAVDDVAYLEGLLDEVEAALPIDATRIYFVGHSNGGFMSYRMACDASERIAAIATLAGSDFEDATGCVPTNGPSVLHMHGTADTTIPYTGGAIGTAMYPGAVEVAERWATRAGCDPTMSTMGTALDLVSVGPADETIVTDYAGCTNGRAVSLWTMNEAPHIPGVRRGVFADAVLDWLLERSR